MTDQLRQALEKIGFPGQGNAAEVILAAARAWSEFPTDAQVEAAAQILVEATTRHGAPLSDGWCAVIARAALEAAHNTGKDGP